MRTKFQRFMAFMLAFVLLLGGQITASAASDSLTDVTIESMRDLLGAISYSSYRDKHSVKDNDGSIMKDENGEAIWEVGEATSDIIVNGVDYDSTNTTATVSKETYDGVDALYIPGKGSVSCCDCRGRR